MITITLKAEDEELIRQRLVCGPFQSAEEIVHHALETLAAQEAWLQENSDTISAKIDRAWAEFERGEGIPGDEARRRLQAMKKTRSDSLK
jgi:hypothetical protein